MAMSTYLAIITLSVNVLNLPICQCSETEKILRKEKKKRLIYMLSTRDSLKM